MPPNDGGIEASSDAEADGSSSSCNYTLVYENPGELHTVTATHPAKPIYPLSMDEAFYCMRVEFDVMTDASLDESEAIWGACPERVILAEIRGTGPDGLQLASGGLSSRDESCAVRSTTAGR